MNSCIYIVNGGYGPNHGIYNIDMNGTYKHRCHFLCHQLLTLIKTSGTQSKCMVLTYKVLKNCVPTYPWRWEAINCLCTPLRRTNIDRFIVYSRRPVLPLVPFRMKFPFTASLLPVHKFIVAWVSSYWRNDA